MKFPREIINGIPNRNKNELSNSDGMLEGVCEDTSAPGEISMPFPKAFQRAGTAEGNAISKAIKLLSKVSIKEKLPIIWPPINE